MTRHQEKSPKMTESEEYEKSKIPLPLDEEIRDWNVRVVRVCANREMM